MRLARSNHVNLTVTQLDRSVQWYCQVFGLVVGADETSVAPNTAKALRYRSLFDPATSSYVVGLIEHPDGIPEVFDERRVGLDHLAFHVPEQGDLQSWADHLDKLGIDHSGIKQTDYEHVITVRDPDGIQLEICWPNSSWWSALLASQAKARRRGRGA